MRKRMHGRDQRSKRGIAPHLGMQVDHLDFQVVDLPLQGFDQILLVYEPLPKLLGLGLELHHLTYVHRVWSTASMRQIDLS